MKPTRLAMLSCVLAIATVSIPAFAQDPADPTAGMSEEHKAMMAAWEKAAAPGPQHAQLAKHFVGTWDTVQSFWMDPAAPPTTETGKAVTTAELGGRQMRMVYTGNVMGAPFEGWGLTGYDNVGGHYTGVWLDNMSTGTYATTGHYDDASATYTFKGQWPDPMQAGEMIRVRETLQIVDADHHVMEMFESHDGEERRTMRIEFRRAR